MPKKQPSHRTRLETTLAGATPDRVPVALWRHFPVDDQTPAGLAEAVVSWQRTYDFDFVKVTPESTYSVKDYGLQDEWQGSAEGTRTYTHRPVKTPDDWLKLTPLDPRAGRIGDQITALRMIASALGPEVPVIETIFSPLTMARKLVGEQQFLVHMRRYPDALHAGLKTLTETTLRFLDAIRDTGISGIFYALQYAQLALMSPTEFQEFARPYHLQVLEAAASRHWFNVLHLHGNDVMFEQVATFPVQVINWHDQETFPSLAEGQKIFPGVACGGLKQWQTMVLGSPEQVRAEAKAAIEATGGTRFILGTGCVTPITAPHGNLMAARKSVSLK
ncbi:MAG TPA: uroporphyrinogen decarboxylase family protein [Anaerolineales bacterium]|nr:uroporphyrinogen decarboxylase family protein [Anaerolineales bacterium]